MADPADEQTADGLGAKLITGRPEDEGVQAMIPTPAPVMDKSAQWYGLRRSENKGDSDRGPERTRDAGPECQPDRDTEP
jgi:hypothetical protein